ncbi:MAG: helix-turn-helix domain-containing protein [Limisphaerales bacterium]
MNKSASIRFQRRLRQLREQRDWTQEKAAEMCGIGYKLYQLYELGLKRNPGLLTLEKIAAGFGLDICELLAQNFPTSSSQAKASAAWRRAKRKIRRKDPARMAKRT